MATLTLDIEEKAMLAAKEAFDAEYKKSISEGMTKFEATTKAKAAGSKAYNANLK
jgi:hypothetical protein